jgi:hypothetical protein
MERLAAAVLVVIAAAWSPGCILPDPDYENTAFSCAEPPFSCPDGYVCRVGRCEATEPEQGAPDAGVDRPDADTELPTDDPNDDPPMDDPPDAAPTPETVTSFGERPGTDVSGVTFDTTIKQEKPLEENGNDDQVGIDADPVHHGLIRFDLSSLPASAQVLGAELEIYLGNPNESGQLVATQLLEDWEENEANWLQRRDNQLWSKDGAAAPPSSANALVASFDGRQEGTYVLPLSAALVQGWVTNPSTNFGLLWKSTSPDGRGGNFESSESANGNQRPVLRVRYR